MFRGLWRTSLSIDVVFCCSVTLAATVRKEDMRIGTRVGVKRAQGSSSRKGGGVEGGRLVSVVKRGGNGVKGERG